MAAEYSVHEWEIFSLALGEAWEHLSRTGQSQDEALDKSALAEAILKAAALGERSKGVLVAYALAHFEHAKIAMLLGGR